jgi:hypothetical protein
MDFLWLAPHTQGLWSFMLCLVKHLKGNTLDCLELVQESVVVRVVTLVFPAQCIHYWFNWVWWGLDLHLCPSSLFTSAWIFWKLQIFRSSICQATAGTSCRVGLPPNPWSHSVLPFAPKCPSPRAQHRGRNSFGATACVAISYGPDHHTELCAVIEEFLIANLDLDLTRIGSKPQILKAQLTCKSESVFLENTQ